MGYSLGNTYLYYAWYHHLIDAFGFFLENCILFYFLLHLFPFKTTIKKKKTFVLIFICTDTLLQVSKDLLPVSFSLQQIIYFLLLLFTGLLFAFLFLSGEASLKIVYTTFFTFSFCLYTRIFLYLFTLLLSGYENSGLPVPVFTVMYLGRRVFQNVLFFLLLYFFFHLKPGNSKVSQKTRSMIFSLVFSIIFLFSLTMLHFSTSTIYNSLFDYFLLLTYLFFSAYAFRLKSTYQEETNAYRLLNQKLFLEQENYQDVSELHENLRQMRHDFQSHIFVMDSLLVDKKYDELHQYFIQFQNLLPDISLVDTGSHPLNAVINERLKFAQEHDIKMSTQISLPQDLQIDILDLCSIVNNLCSNALEASLHSTLKNIFLNIHSAQGYLSILVKNDVDYNVLEKNPGLHTSKTDKTIHGQGLKIVRKIVNKYDGLCRFQVVDSVFIASVQLKNRACNFPQT